MSEPIYFAIGDIHGEADKLAGLHAAILDRVAFEGCPARIVHLGDYVDRGPDSRGVIDRILALEARFADAASVNVLSLLGNHEQMMLSHLTAPTSAWLSAGGSQTLNSYGVPESEHMGSWETYLPREHLGWLRNLPTLHHDAQRRLAFVHAGIDPAAFPFCDNKVRIWTRSEKFRDTSGWPDRRELDGLTVVHGHTPTLDNEPEVRDRRINVDTGACFGGPLTAVMLKPGYAPAYLRAR